MKSSAGRRRGLIAPSTPISVPIMIEMNGKFNRLHEAGKQPVEMNQNRAELQGGLHGHPVARAGRAGPATAPPRWSKSAQKTGRAGSGWLRYFIDSASSVPSVFSVNSQVLIHCRRLSLPLATPMPK